MGELILRKVSLEDSSQILAISNLQEVRQFSINKNTISKEEHEQWFHQNLSEPFWVAEKDGEVCGQVRFSENKGSDPLYTISVSVHPRVQGEGLGEKLVRLGLNHAISEKWNGVRAQIHDDNLPSVRLFTKLGFKSMGEPDELGFRNYAWNRQTAFLKGIGPSLIIAELSANHGHNIEVAIETIRAMKKSGADAVKIQTYTADTMTLDCDEPDFLIDQGTLWDGRNLHELYQEAYTPWEWHNQLRDVAHEEGMLFFSSPFDATSVDFLEELGVPFYKLASFEITDIPLIKKIASKNKPIIMSSGISELEDLDLAVKTFRELSDAPVVLLKCTSAYPAELSDANLTQMETLAARYGCTVGVSDHTMGHVVPVTAVAMGAKVVEKHFILDRSVGGPDASFSMTPGEFREMVDEIRKTESTFGNPQWNLSEKSKTNRSFSRSIYVSKDIEKGEEFSVENLRVIRPGYGLHPKHFEDCLGKKASRKIARGERMSLDLLN